MFGVCLANRLDCSRVQRPRQIDARNLGAEERALALLDPEQVVGDRVVGDAGDDPLALALQGDIDREVRDGVQEVGGAVQRVDNPDRGGRIGTFGDAAFFHLEAPVGACLCQFAPDGAFGIDIGAADKISRPFTADL